MFKTNPNQVITVFIDGELYTCLSPDYPIQAFREFMYSYINSKNDCTLSLKDREGSELNPENIYDISNGSDFNIEASIDSFKSYNPKRTPSRITNYYQIQLTAINILKP